MKTLGEQGELPIADPGRAHGRLGALRPVPLNEDRDDHFDCRPHQSRGDPADAGLRDTLDGLRRCIGQVGVLVWSGPLIASGGRHQSCRDREASRLPQQHCDHPQRSATLSQSSRIALTSAARSAGPENTSRPSIVAPCDVAPSHASIGEHTTAGSVPKPRRSRSAADACFPARPTRGTVAGVVGMVKPMPRSGSPLSGAARPINDGPAKKGAWATASRRSASRSTPMRQAAPATHQPCSESIGRVETAPT